LTTIEYQLDACLLITITDTMK